MFAYFSLPETFLTAYAIDIHLAFGIVRFKFGWTVHKDQVVGGGHGQRRNARKSVAIEISCIHSCTKATWSSVEVRMYFDKFYRVVSPCCLDVYGFFAYRRSLLTNTTPTSTLVTITYPK
jgi:hypothetical protein